MAVTSQQQRKYTNTAAIQEQLINDVMLALPPIIILYFTQSFQSTAMNENSRAMVDSARTAGYLKKRTLTVKDKQEQVREETARYILQV